jgi:hypothetical protein
MFNPSPLFSVPVALFCEVHISNPMFLSVFTFQNFIHCVKFLFMSSLLASDAEAVEFDILQTMKT